MKITTIGIDLAKEVFQIHGVDERGKAVLRKQLKRSEMAKYVANLPACLIGMEACGSAHHWARKLKGYGHTVKLKAPQFVKPYVKTNKNDMADAEAICEAVDRPNMRFVAHKNVEQQAITASAIVATVGDAREFKNGRQLAAWFGLVPKQHSSGGKQTLLGISKRGDTYLCTLLIHGARAVLRFAEKKAEPNGWLIKRMVRRNKNVAAVALANKNARIIWALLTKGQTFRSDYATAVAVA